MKKKMKREEEALQSFPLPNAFPLSEADGGGISLFVCWNWNLPNFLRGRRCMGYLCTRRRRSMLISYVLLLLLLESDAANVFLGENVCRTKY